jgi:hypothetical protein
MSQAHSRWPYARQITGIATVATISVAVITACNYNVTFEDCEVGCTGLGDCPDGFSCQNEVCRVSGATGSCGSGSGSGLPPGTITLRQTANDTIDSNLVFDCTNTDNTTAAQSWFRVLSPEAAGVSGAFHVSSVNVGIGFADEMTAVNVIVGTYAGGLGSATLGSAEVSNQTMVSAMIPPTQLTELVPVPITATIPAGMNAYVEIDAPDLLGTSNEIAIGSTDSAQTEPAYFEAPHCNIDVPTSTTQAGFANAAFVITVEGSD